MIPAAGAHGGDGPAVAAALGVEPAGMLDLSLSLNPVAPDAAEVVAKHVDAVGRYPDPAAATAALAAAMGVGEDRVVLTNGGSEAITLVATELGGGWVDEPDFGLYPRQGPRRWRSNPHNPSGRLAGPGERADVWDEAFYPLAAGRWTSGEEGAVVIGSLTKVFACPGLRAGYVLADPELIGRVRARQPTWSLNGLAAEALPDLLETADLPGWTAAVAALRSELVGLLRAHGLDPEPSDANYVLVPGAAGVRERLAVRGVVVRDCASFGLPDHVRIAVPDAAGLARLEEALTEEALTEGALTEGALTEEDLMEDTQCAAD